MGVVKNPSGAVVAEMGIIPESIVVPGATRLSSSRKLESRLAKRDTYVIQGTSYQVVVAQGAIALAGSVLANIAKHVLDSILLEPAFKGYTALLTNGQLRDLWGPNAFSLVAHGGVIIGCIDMLEIVRTIFFVVDTYSSRRTIFGLRRRNLLRNLQGLVVGAAGNHIATWATGGVPPQDLATASLGPGVGVTEADGSLALSCVRT